MAAKKTEPKTEEEEQQEAIEGAKPICFSYDGTDYTLEFNRSSVRLLESRYDFSIDDLERSKTSKLPDLFYCSFMWHHPDTKRSRADEIFAKMADKGALLTRLVTLFYKTVNETMGEPSKGEAISWQ